MSPHSKGNLRETYVFAWIHFEIQVERVGRVRLDDFLHEFYENRVFTENTELVHRFEVNRDKKRPRQLRIDPFTAFDAKHLRNFQELHPCVHHHLFDASGSDLGFELIKDDVVNHGRLKLLGGSGETCKWE